VWLFGQLAQRMGFEEECFRDTAREIIAQAIGAGPDGRATRPEMEHITLDELREKGHVPLAFHREPETNPFKPYLAGPLPTPTGKVEFYSESLAAKGLDPLPSFIPPVESRWTETAERYPLEMLARKNDNYMNSTFANLPGHRKMEAKTNQSVELHPADAEARGIASGDRVRVFNDRGSLELTALVGASVPEGVVAGRLDWAKLHGEAVNINVLTSERLTDIGGGPTFYSTLVEVEKQS
jgi:anaerobic selenocysteine-containing dehydrogenase